MLLIIAIILEHWNYDNSLMMEPRILERMRPLHADCCPVQSYVLFPLPNHFWWILLACHCNGRSRSSFKRNLTLSEYIGRIPKIFPLLITFFFNSDKIYYYTYCIVYCKRGKFCIYEVLESVSKALTLFSPFLKWAGLYDSFSRCWHSVKTLFFWDGYLRHLPLTRVVARP